VFQRLIALAGLQESRRLVEVIRKCGQRYTQHHRQQGG
jgi:hypothetical protein